jgi:broad specificity phosphatase PhoE
MTVIRNRILLWTMSLLIVTLNAKPALGGQAIFLVRHGEKVDDSRDAALNEAGRARAARLAQLLKDAGISAVYTTDFQRTRDTAKPLAEKLNVQPIIVSREAEDVIGRVRALGDGQNALVVAHSDTLPDILKRLGYQEKIAIANEEYDNLFIVIQSQNGAPTILRLRY